MKNTSLVDDNEEQFFFNARKGYMINKYQTMKSLRGIKIKPTKGSDKQYYVDFAGVFKVLTKRAFKNNNLSQFKVTNKKLKDKLKKGWDHTSSNDVKKKKNRTSKDLIT